MLRSAHIPFNLFAPLIGRPELTNRLLYRILGVELLPPYQIKPEWAPKPAEKYLADSERLVELAARTERRGLFVDQPVRRGDLVSGTHPGFRPMPERHPGGNVRFLSTWASVSPGGHFLQSAPCEAVEPGCIDGMGELRSPPPYGHLAALGPGGTRRPSLRSSWPLAGSMPQSST